MCAVEEYAPGWTLSFTAYNLPRLDDLLAEQLYRLEDADRAELWVKIESKLRTAAKQEHAFAQRLLGDFYSRIREGGMGGNVDLALRWYEEAAKSGVIDLSGEYEAIEEDGDDEFDDDLSAVPGPDSD